jgi:hypothetical protein
MWEYIIIMAMIRGERGIITYVSMQVARNNSDTLPYSLLHYIRYIINALHGLLINNVV